MERVSKRNIVICVCSLLMVLTSAQVLAGSDNVLLIRGCENLYANLFHEISVSEDANEVTLVARMKVNERGATSWGPSAYLYANTGDTVGAQWWHEEPPQINMSGSGQLSAMEWALSDEADLQYGEWFELKIVYDSMIIGFYARANGQTEWTLLTESFVFEGPNAITGIIIGKGYQDGGYTNDKRRNSYSDPGAPVEVYVDYVTVSIDGEEIFREDFETSVAELEAAGWDLEGDQKISEVRQEVLAEDPTTPIFEIIPRP